MAYLVEFGPRAAHMQVSAILQKSYCSYSRTAFRLLKGIARRLCSSAAFRPTFRHLHTVIRCRSRFTSAAKPRRVGLGVRFCPNRSGRFFSSYKISFPNFRNRSVLFQSRNRRILVPVLSVPVLTEGTEFFKMQKTIHSIGNFSSISATFSCNQQDNSNK
jgi:hypothetical protein